MNGKINKKAIYEIRDHYIEKEITDFDMLKALDKKVKLPAKRFSYVLGTVSALVMGFGMSLVMTEISDILGVTKPMTVGIAVGAVGLAAAVANYPIHKFILKLRREKYADEVVVLSEKIINDEEI